MSIIAPKQQTLIALLLLSTLGDLLPTGSGIVTPTVQRKWTDDLWLCNSSQRPHRWQTTINDYILYQRHDQISSRS
uniref:Putative secreted protein n=1 Tax=Anopheles darlingi TaxID=43151 RepID=A0A2M4DPU9_ANODA